MRSAANLFPSEEIPCTEVTLPLHLAKILFSVRLMFRAFTTYHCPSETCTYASDYKKLPLRGFDGRWPSPLNPISSWMKSRKGSCCYWATQRLDHRTLRTSAAGGAEEEESYERRVIRTEQRTLSSQCLDTLQLNWLWHFTILMSCLLQLMQGRRTPSPRLC